MANILIIAGFDPTGGAGLQADLKTVTALGEVGITVATALTIQDTAGVKGWKAVEELILKDQLEVIGKDIEIDVIKIGMVPTTKAVSIIASFIQEIGPKYVIIDPVFQSKNGVVLTPVLKDVTSRLFPLATLVTPNQKEAEVLLGRKIQTMKEMEQAAQDLMSFGQEATLVTGGEFERATDVFYDGKRLLTWATFKRQKGPVHGTGCVYSSAIAAFLAKGFPLERAIEKARKFVTVAIDGAIKVGKGHLLSNPCAWIERDKARFEIIESLNQALEKMQSLEELPSLIPEVRSNMVYALPYARGHDEVAGFAGRLTVVKGKVWACAGPCFGASKHMASVVLKAMDYNPDLRAAMNIKYDPKIIEKAYQMGYRVKEVFRTSEAAETKLVEGKSMPWLTEQAMKEEIPDFIYDKGDWGKEPMIRVLGKNPSDILNKVTSIIKRR